MTDTETTVPAPAAPADGQVTPDELRRHRDRKRRQQKAEEDLKNAPAEELAEILKLRRQEEAQRKAQEEEAAAAIPAGPPPEFPYDEVFGMDPATRAPDGYKVNTGGVYVRLKGPDGPEWVRICHAPLVITSVYNDAKGDQSVELAWRSRGVVVRRMVSRGLIRRGRKLIEEIGAAGLPVIEADARAVERWFAEFELANIKTLPAHYVARNLGWQPDGAFVASVNGDTRVDPTYQVQHLQAAAYHQHGTLKSWQKGMEPLKDYPVPRVAMAASFGAALLPVVGVASFTLDISSRSTRGKTTCVQCGLSVWADPSEDARALGNWRSTLISIEKRLNLVRGLPTILDETMVAKTEELVGNVIYDIPKGVGTERQGAYPSMLEWLTILICTGERPALTYSTHQGAAGRTLSLTLPPFGEQGGPTAVAARDAAFANYGLAGPEFVAELTSRLAKAGAREKLQSHHAELTEQLLGATDMTGRRAPMVATLVLAERLACSWGILPYDPMPIEQWQGLFTDVPNDSDNRPEMAIDVLRQYVAAHGRELYQQNVSTREEQPHTGWLGIMPSPGLTEWVAIAPERVRTILGQAGYSLDAVLQGWVEAGYLELAKSQRPPHLIKKKLLGAQAKYLVFTKAGIDME